MFAGIALLAAGCGGTKSESLPTACSEGPTAIVKALAEAPAPVTIQGTPISHCFNVNASRTDIQVVGTNLLAAAQQLADQKRALALGYLVGAARRGSARNNGLGSEIARRLDMEGAALPAGRADYQRGVRAGLAQG